MSDTPRTDFEESIQTQRFGVYMVKADFARTLEREIAAMLEQIEHLGKANSMLHLDLVDAHAETAKETKRADKLEAETAAMREAIMEAYATLEDWELLWKEQAGLVSSRAFEDGRPVSKASIGARSKLQPYLKP